MAKGLRKVKEILDIMKLPDAERRQYEAHQENARAKKSVLDANYLEGLMEGRQEGREEGREEGKKEAQLTAARNLLLILDDAAIAAVTGLTSEVVAGLR